MPIYAITILSFLAASHFKCFQLRRIMPQSTLIFLRVSLNFWILHEEKDTQALTNQLLGGDDFLWYVVWEKKVLESLSGGWNGQSFSVSWMLIASSDCSSWGFQAMKCFPLQLLYFLLFIKKKKRKETGLWGDRGGKDTRSRMGSNQKKNFLKNKQKNGNPKGLSVDTGREVKSRWSELQ